MTTSGKNVKPFIHFVTWETYNNQRTSHFMIVDTDDEETYNLIIIDLNIEVDRK